MTMKADIPTSPAATALPPAPPQLRPALFEDYPRIREMESSYLHATLPEQDWRGLFLDNPLWPRLSREWPLGWVLEDPAGRVVGSLTNIPSLYQFRGAELICANGRSWAVAPEYRGFALWLMDEYYNQPGVDLFVNTTVNQNGTAAAITYSNRVPVGDWETIAYWVTGYRGFARKALEKMGVRLAGALALPVAAGLWVKDALFARNLSSHPGNQSGDGKAEIETADGFDSRFDRFWEELVRQNPDRLLGARDSRSLAWHYAIPLRQGRLWVFTAARNGLLRAWCVLKREDRREGVRRMRLIDYQSVEPDADLLPLLLRAALKRCATEDIWVLEHLGCALPKMRSLDRCAPYRRKLPCWPYYFHTVDPALAAELMKAEAWDASAFDGDASFE
jgi:hypothetical protein